MRFLKLDDLKVEKGYDYDTVEINIPLNFNAPVKESNAAIEDVARQSVKDSAKDTFYDIILNLNDVHPETLTEEDFLGLVNVITSAFIRALCIEGKGRPREHRLDVPEKLKRDVRLTMSILKKAVNTKTIQDHFNIRITCGEWVFDMIEQDLNVENPTNIINKEFVHEKDELTPETADKKVEDK